MRTSRLLFFLSALGAGLLRAQASGVEGIVLDPSGRSIRSAEVRCDGRLALSAVDGRFRIEGAARCQAGVAAAGFETQTIELVAGGANRVTLRVAGVVERIVVSATRHETSADEAGVAASVVTRGDIERRQFPAAADLLREVPGLSVVKTGREGALTVVFTRGAQRTGTLVLLDGTPLNDPGGEVNFGQLLTGAVDHVEVVRGAESALFGAEAAAGVVQLFTRRGDVEDKLPRGRMSYERGSFGTGRWMASLAGGTGARLDYALAAEQIHTAGEFANDAYRNTAGSANLGLRLSQGTRVRGVFRSSDATLGVPGQVAYGLVDTDAGETTRDTALSLRLDDARGARYLQSFSFGYHRNRDVFTDPRMEGPFTLALLVRDGNGSPRRVYREAILDPGHIPAQAPPGLRLIRESVTLYPMDEPFLSDTWRERAGYQGTLSHGSGAAVFGYDYERQQGKVSSHDVARDRNGLFVHEQYSLARRVFLAGGVRLEHSSAFGRKVAPRGAASFLLAGEHGPLSSTLVRVGAGRGVTEPSLLQNFARELFFTGNPSLRPEKTSSYEFGLVQEWCGRRLRTEAALFHNSFQDLIAFVSLPAPVYGTWQNVEASRARGVEVSGRARLASALHLSASYTRLWTRITRSNSPNSLFTGLGQELSRRPGNSGAVSLSLAPRRWWLEAGAVLVGERQDTDFFGINRNRGYQNAYAALSLRVHPHLSPFARVDNLLNSRYEEVLGYSSLSRSVRGGVRVEW